MSSTLQMHYERFLATFRAMTDEDGTPLFKGVHAPLQRLQEPFPSVEVYYTDHFQVQILVGEMTGANNAEVDTLALALADRLWFHYGWRFALGYIMFEGHVYRCMGHHFWNWTI